MNTMRLTMAAFVLAALTLMQGATAVAASGYKLFGDAEIVSGGNPGNAAQLRSDLSRPPFYGGVDFNVSGLTFAQFTQLATDYNVTDDQCGAGSPRFQLNTAAGSIWVYIGPSPSFIGCAPGWQTTGNLIGNNDPCRYDTSQLTAGTQCNTYAGTLLLFSSVTITGIQLVVDSGWNAVASGGDGEETILVDNVKINGTTYTFEPTSGAAQVTGGGQINGTTGRANFGFNVRQGTIVSGHINYRNHTTGAELNCPVTTLSINGNTATFGNTATGCNFTVIVQDYGNPGKGNDTFNITSSSTTPTESNSGTLTAGNIQVRSGP